VPERRAVDDCVHCGFCLPVCPTYVSWAAEMDSPRGRIDLARAVGEGRQALGPSVIRHLDTCLGCLACLAACPSGVRYDVVIEEAKAGVERAGVRPVGDRLHRALLFALFPYPARLRVAALLLWLWRVTGLQWALRRSGLLRLASRRLAQLEALAPRVTWRHLASRLPSRVPAEGERRARVGLLGGCVQRVFFPGVNEATLRVLAAEGCEVVVPPGQGCCGALSAHAGRQEEAARMARALVETFEAAGVETVVVNAAGCGSHLKDLDLLFRGDPAFAARAAAFSRKVRDVSEFLAALGPVAPRGPYPVRVAYHSSCHLGHAQGITRQPRELLRAVPGLDLVEIPSGDECCGSAGIYNLVQAESADEIGRRKAAAVLATGAPVVAAANPGCTLHIQKMLRERGEAVEAAHPVEILDASIRAGRLGRRPPGA
jgi:glycolate oxidase iron-sulfur subunit